MQRRHGKQLALAVTGDARLHCRLPPDPVAGSQRFRDDEIQGDAERLSEGTLEGTVVTCGCHGAQFDVTSGAVLAPPAPEPVKSYPLHVDQGNLVIEV